MYVLQEALAREHQRECEDQAREHRVVAEHAAARRWRYLERRVQQAHRRHARRADRLAQLPVRAK